MKTTVIKLVQFTIELLIVAALLTGCNTSSQVKPWSISKIDGQSPALCRNLPIKTLSSGDYHWSSGLSLKLNIYRGTGQCTNAVWVTAQNTTGVAVDMEIHLTREDLARSGYIYSDDQTKTVQAHETWDSTPMMGLDFDLTNPQHLIKVWSSTSSNGGQVTCNVLRNGGLACSS